VGVENAVFNSLTSDVLDLDAFDAFVKKVRVRGIYATSEDGEFNQIRAIAEQAELTTDEIVLILDRVVIRLHNLIEAQLIVRVSGAEKENIEIKDIPAAFPLSAIVGNDHYLMHDTRGTDPNRIILSHFPDDGIDMGLGHQIVNDHIDIGKDAAIGGNRTWHFSPHPDYPGEDTAFLVTLKSKSPVSNILYVNKLRTKEKKEPELPDRFDLLDREASIRMAEEEASLVSNRRGMITVVNTLSPFRNEVQARRIPLREAKKMISTGRVVGILEGGLEYFMWANNIPGHGEVSVVGQALEESEGDQVIRSIMELTEPELFWQHDQREGVDFDMRKQGALTRAQALLARSGYKGSVVALNSISFRGQTARAHVGWVNNKEQALRLVAELLRHQGRRDKLVIGFNQNDAELQKMSRDSRFARLKEEGRLIFAPGTERTTVMDLVSHIPEAERRKMAMNILILGGTHMPDGFFNLSETDWKLMQNQFEIYVVTEALAAIAISVSQIPNLTALRKALEAA
jgi:hypothetical protein